MRGLLLRALRSRQHQDWIASAALAAYQFERPNAQPSCLLHTVLLTFASHCIIIVHYVMSSLHSENMNNGIRFIIVNVDTNIHIKSCASIRTTGRYSSSPSPSRAWHQSLQRQGSQAFREASSDCREEGET